MSQLYPKFLYDSRLNDGTVTASTTAAGFAAANLRDWRPYTWWKPTAVPASVSVNCGSAKSADYCAIYAHDCGSRGNTIQVVASTDGYIASNVVMASIVPTNDLPIVLTWTPASYRWWGIYITNGTAPTLAIAAIGSALTMPKLLGGGFDPLRRQVVGQTNRSESGHPLGRIIDWEAWEQELSWGLLSWTWLRSTWVPAWKAHLRGTPYLFAWDAGDHPTESYLVQSGESYDTPHTSGLYADLRLTVKGVAP